MSAPRGGDGQAEAVDRPAQVVVLLGRAAAAGPRAAPPRRPGSRTQPARLEVEHLVARSRARSACRSRAAAGRRARTTTAGSSPGRSACPSSACRSATARSCHQRDRHRRAAARRRRRGSAASRSGCRRTAPSRAPVNANPSQLLAEVLDHVVALGLAVHEHVEAERPPGTRRPRRSAPSGSARRLASSMRPARRSRRAARISARLRERADRRRRQLGQRDALDAALRGAPTYGAPRS